MTLARQIPPHAMTPPAADDLPTFDARDLVQNGVQARIILDDQLYWLRITRAGKLILTK